MDEVFGIFHIFDLNHGLHGCHLGQNQSLETETWESSHLRGLGPVCPLCHESHDAGGPGQLVASGCGGHHGGRQDPRHKDQDWSRRPRGLSIRVPGRWVAWCSPSWTIAQKTGFCMSHVFYMNVSSKIGLEWREFKCIFSKSEKWLEDRFWVVDLEVK